jgi:hypothetical protein
MSDPLHDPEEFDRPDKPRAKGTLPKLGVGRDPAMLRRFLTVAFAPAEGWQVDTFDRAGREKRDPCSLVVRNGREHFTYRFRNQGDLHSAQLRAVVNGVSDGELAMPHLTPGEIEDVWVALCRLGRVLSEHDDRAEAIAWMEQLLTASVPLRAQTGQTLAGDNPARHDALMAIRAQGEFQREHAERLLRPGGKGDLWLRRPVRFIDLNGSQWVRKGETATFVRWVLGVEPLAVTSLTARLAEIGVHARHFQAWTSPHPKAWLYELTADLIEYVDGDTSAESGGGSEA